MRWPDPESPEHLRKLRKQFFDALEFVADRYQVEVKIDRDENSFEIVGECSEEMESKIASDINVILWENATPSLQ